MNLARTRLSFRASSLDAVSAPGHWLFCQPFCILGNHFTSYYATPMGNSFLTSNFP